MLHKTQLQQSSGVRRLQDLHAVPARTDDALASSNTDFRAWARSVLEATNPSHTGRVDEIDVLRDGHKLLMLVRHNGQWLALKQYADDRGAWTQRWMQLLADAGMVPSAQHSITPARGWSAHHRTLVADRAPGESWASSLLAQPTERDAIAAGVAGWVAHLQSLSLPLPDRSGYRAGDQLIEQSTVLASEFPGWAARITDLAEASHRRLYGSLGRQPVLVPSHGDLHPGNIFIDVNESMQFTAIDLDTVGMRRPAYDIGYALSQMLVSSWMHTGSFAPGAGAGLAFWNHWKTASGHDSDAVPAEVTRALVQSLHFELITYRTNRLELLGLWLGLAEAMLRDGVASTLNQLIAPKGTDR